jgi:hypothetical protein
MNREEVMLEPTELANTFRRAVETLTHCTPERRTFIDRELLRAASEIDRLTAENKRLDRWPDYFAWEREYKKLEAKNRRLTAENKDLINIKNWAYEACSTGNPEAELKCIDFCDKFEVGRPTKENVPL